MTKERQVILLPDYLTVRELAEMTQATPLDIMKRLIGSGVMASINQQIDFDTASIILEDMGFDVQSASEVAAQAERSKAAESQTWRQVYSQEKTENLHTRPPVVTILGHVDHGKTTLLDNIRKAHVADGEAGGITQHIGAYRAYHNNAQLTFLDTPGHEIFTAMRARGAQGADIAVLVVAADDGVMGTTKEALSHARAANIPFVVAITKIDKPNANPDRVKQEMAELGVVPDEWGGDTMFVPVSALRKQGVEDLLEALLLLAGDGNIVANPQGHPSGIVLEARIDRTRGAMVTLLVLNGTLKRGDTLIVGKTYGRVKAMFDETGKQIDEAIPSTPVSVLGITELPEPGERFEWVKNEKTARGIIDEQQSDVVRERQRRPSLEEIFAQYQSGETKELTLVLKVDVQGSLQPIVDQLESIKPKNNETIKVRLLTSDIGNISESDVNLASASNAIIIGFGVEIDNAAQRAANSLGVEVRHYDVVYKLFEDIELAVNGMLEPEYADRTVGRAEVRQVFKISRVGAIAGSYILEGVAQRKAFARVVRGNNTLVEKTAVSSLKRVNEDASEVRTGFECGIGLTNFNDFQEGDIIEFFVTERVK
ncbi:MAG: translation initiation factor IF-2 [Phototrophicaceae bacterium]